MSRTILHHYIFSQNLSFSVYLSPFLFLSIISFTRVYKNTGNTSSQIQDQQAWTFQSWKTCIPSHQPAIHSSLFIRNNYILIKAYISSIFYLIIATEFKFIDSNSTSIHYSLYKYRQKSCIQIVISKNQQNSNLSSSVGIESERDHIPRDRLTFCGSLEVW